MTTPTIIYTDGACSGNPGPGGWAWVVPHGPYGSGGEDYTTNQRMELMAVLAAVRSLEGPLEIVSDSTYVVNCFRDRWWEGWLRRGWVNSQKKPVANRDLWEPLIELCQERDVSFRWVKGHSGDPWNEEADRLAVEAGGRQVAACGETGDAAERGSDASHPSAVMEIEGHVLVVMGHRPPDLGGYGENLFAAAVREQLRAVIEAKAAMHEDLVVISGMNLGAETLAIEAAAEVSVPYEAILPFPHSESRWPSDSQKRFRSLVDQARKVRTLERKTPDSNQKVAGSFRRREAWIRRNADEAIVVWDGKDRAIGKSVRSLQDDLGEENVWVINSNELK